MIMLMFIITAIMIKNIMASNNYKMIIIKIIIKQKQ